MEELDKAGLRTGWRGQEAVCGDGPEPGCEGRVGLPEGLEGSTVLGTQRGRKERAIQGGTFKAALALIPHGPGLSLLADGSLQRAPQARAAP